MHTGYLAKNLKGLAILFVFGCCAGTAGACPVCFSLNDPFALPHPKAIEISVATRMAIQKGQIQANPLVSSRKVVLQGGGFISLDKVSAPSMITTWTQHRSFAMKPGRSLTIHFLFIDSNEACGLDIRTRQAIVQSKLSRYSDSRVVTTKTVFFALMTGQLSLAQAEEEGLLLLEGEACVRQLFSP